MNAFDRSNMRQRDGLFPILLLALLWLITRGILFACYEPLTYQDSGTYQRLAHQIMTLDFTGYDGQRTPGYPLLPARLAPGFDSAVSIIHHARTCLAPQVMLAGLALGIVVWGSEGLPFHFVLDCMGVQVGWWTALFIYAFAMLVGAISFLPGGLGGADATMIGLLAVHNVPLHSAVAATILIRIATLWFAVVLGIGTLGLQLHVGARN